MSREIKFQLVRKADNKIVCSYQEGVIMLPDTGELYQGSMNVTDRYARRQYTGLKDKNGAEIYDGDILGLSYGVYVAVGWNEKTAAFCAISKDEDKSDHSYGAEYCEVFGNIYQNPELLEGGE